MNGRTKLIVGVALNIAAFAAAYTWFPTPSLQQWALFAVGSVLAATGSFMVLRHCFLSGEYEGGVSAAWILAEPILLSGCGAVPFGILLSIAGTSMLVIAVAYAWQDQWGINIPLAIMSGFCFGAAYTILRQV